MMTRPTTVPAGIDAASHPLTGSQLFDLIKSGQQAEVDGWSLGLLDGMVWLTDPYGNDVAFFDATADACERILCSLAEAARAEVGRAQGVGRER